MLVISKTQAPIKEPAQYVIKVRFFKLEDDNISKAIFNENPKVAVSSEKKIESLVADLVSANPHALINAPIVRTLEDHPCSFQMTTGSDNDDELKFNLTPYPVGGGLNLLAANWSESKSPSNDSVGPRSRNNYFHAIVQSKREMVAKLALRDGTLLAVFNVEVVRPPRGS